MIIALISRMLCVSILLIGASVEAANVATGPFAERVLYLSRDRLLQGCVYKPEGKGPFPVVVFLQAAVKKLEHTGPISPFPAIGKFYTSRGYALFVPGRHPLRGEGDQEEKPDGERKATETYELSSGDLIAAVEFAQAQSWADEKRIVLTGHAGGATVILIAAEKLPNVRGYVAFSPAASLWSNTPPVQTLLQRCVENARAPVFVIQPQNDFNVEPTRVLGAILDKKGGANRSRIYPPYRQTVVEANTFAYSAPEIWGNDVLSFLSEVLK